MFDDSKVTIDNEFFFETESLAGFPVYSREGELFTGHLSGDYYTAWFVDGVLHREDDLPAVVYHNDIWEWFVYGVRHRVNGSQRVGSLGRDDKYALLGVNLDATDFYMVLAHERKFQCPLWVSLFVVLDLITAEQFNSFLDEDKIWDCSLPAEWILKASDVTGSDIINKASVPWDTSEFFERIDRVTEFMKYEQAKVEGM